MSFKGDISSISLGDVIQNLATNQKTGTLSIQSGESTRHVQFREGKIASYTDDQGFSILDWLLDKEIIPENQRDQVVGRYSKAKKKTLGEILEDMKILEPDAYKSYLADLVQETLYEVLSSREGTFEFHEGELDEKLGDREVTACQFQFNPMSVLMEAARKTDDWQNIRRHIPSEHEIYLADPGNRERLLAEAESDVTKEALQLMDGTRTLKKVIQKLPYSRFEACRALAALIEEKKVRPLAADQVIQGSKGDDDPKQAILCFKTILEREPNNREILGKLADLCEKEGARDESATYHKLLAISHLEEKDLESAENRLRKSLELNPKDISTWQKLWDVVRRQNQREKLAHFGCQYFEHFKKQGLMEIARDHLLEMIELFPDNSRLKVELADARFALGDQKGAVQGLFDIACNLLDKERYGDAEKVLARVLKYDRDNKKARKLYDKVHSGQLAKRRAWVRQFVRKAVLFALFLTLCAYLTYELHVRGELLQATKSVFAESILEEKRYDAAIERLQAVQRAYPWSIASSFKVPELLRVLREKQGGGRPAALPAASPAALKSRAETGAGQAPASRVETGASQAPASRTESGAVRSPASRKEAGAPQAPAYPSGKRPTGAKGS